MSVRTFRHGWGKVTLSLLLVGIPAFRASGTVTMLHTGANSGVLPTHTFRAQNYFKFSKGGQASFEKSEIRIIVNKQLSVQAKMR